jgi:acyl phosphate:glycerol-3-phosphate acyltransferase
VIELSVKALLAYLIGSLVGSLLIGSFRGVDIRTMGSGNAGATNMLRTQGRIAALAVLLIDLGKGWVATGLLAPLALPGIPPAEPGLRALLVAVCGLAVIVGHVYPLWYGFRGGKGVATFLGAVLGIDAGLALVMVLTWLVVVILSGFVGLASMAGAGAVAAAIAARNSSQRAPLLVFGVVAALLILYTHRANIGRMLAGTESRARRLWLFGLRRGQS